MGLRSCLQLMLFGWVLLGLLLRVNSDCGGGVKFLKTPRVITNKNAAKFTFRISKDSNGSTCPNCTCKLNDHVPSVCESGEVFYAGLKDGNHTFEVCTKGVGCSSYGWIVDTVPPTAYIVAAMSLTSATNISVNVSFSEPCSGQGGFQCTSVDSCKLLVYGGGQVIPATLNTIHPNLTYSLMVSLDSSSQYGRVTLVLDKSFCTDAAGNKFTRTQNSRFFVHYDKRTMLANLRTHIPERLLQIDKETRTVQATNIYKNLKLYLYFNKPVMNSSTEIIKSIHISQGSLLPIIGDTLGNRRFGFQINNIPNLAVVTVSLNSDVLASKYGTSVSPVAPVTFLYDSQRPAVRLSTTSMRTRHKRLTIMIRFMKPVFGFNSSHISVAGGYLHGFREVSTSTYSVDIKVEANGDIVSISVPENVAKDVSGNGNLASNTLQVKHYSLPAISMALSSFATAIFVLTALAAGLLTISVASLQSLGAFGRRSSSLTSNPTRNLFRIACHIQTFALSRWLAVTLPVEYYEFSRGLQWSIPYFNLPFDIGHTQSAVVPSSLPTKPHSFSSKIYDLGMSKVVQPTDEYLDVATPVYGLPLSPAEYRSFFESQNIPEAEYISSTNDSDGWNNFKKSMFWLAVLGGSLILLHALLVLILKFRKTKSDKKIYGALIFPRFEIFLVILALPCVCEASAALLKGGSTGGTIVGILLLTAVCSAVLALFLFLSAGITYAKLLQYKEVHKEGQKSHWYQELVRVTLGPGKRGQWTWINQSNSVYLTMFGPLFEDLRGPPKYMLSQFVADNPHIHGDRIIASDDETEDAEAPFIQKLFGILRIYYTFIETIKRFCLGILAGAYSENWSSKAPTIILLCITSFQLFFMVLKKPFLKKKVQLVEIISVASELGIFAICFILLEKTFSTKEERNIGICMISLFMLQFLPQMINEWYALYTQTQQLDPAGKSFFLGLKAASVGFLMYFIPQKLMENMYSSLELDKFGDKELVDPSSSGDKNRSSGSRTSGANEKPWMKQLRELAKSSFNKERSGTTANDASTSGTRWSGLWGTRGSRSSSLSTSGDTKSKPKGLYKDLEAIFASK